MNEKRPSSWLWTRNQSLCSRFNARSKGGRRFIFGLRLGVVILFLGLGIGGCNILKGSRRASQTCVVLLVLLALLLLLVMLLLSSFIVYINVLMLLYKIIIVIN